MSLTSTAHPNGTGVLAAGDPWWLGLANLRECGKGAPKAKKQKGNARATQTKVINRFLVRGKETGKLKTNEGQRLYGQYV